MKGKGIAALWNLDVIFLVGLAVLGIVYIIEASGLNNTAARLPRVTAVFMLALIFFVLYGKVRDALRTDAPTAAELKPDSDLPQCEVVEAPEEKPFGRPIFWGIMLVEIALYPVLIMTIGFSLGTFVFITGTTVLLGARVRPAFVFGIVLTVALVALFVYVLKVPMPKSVISGYISALRGF